MTKETKETKGTTLYTEVPSLRVEKVNESYMFNVTSFIEENELDLKIEDYIEERSKIIATYAKLLNIKEDVLILELKDKTMINAALALDFISWYFPEFGVYLYDRCHDMLTNGFAVSNKYLQACATQRFGKKENQE